MNGIIKPTRMTDLLETVAEMTHLRNKEALELHFAEAVYQIAGATRLVIWRVIGRGEEAKLRVRVSLPHGRTGAGGDMLLAERPEFRECVEARRTVEVRLSNHRQTRYLFPLCDERQVNGLLDIVMPRRLDVPQMTLVTGLMRVYGNHAGLLDYGSRDELTGLLNRRTFSSFFKQVAEDDSTRAIIAVIDIDFFKRVNDDLGHMYGDEVLILLARLLEDRFGEQDEVFRFGGEEFLVLLRQETLETAFKALEAFRVKVAEAEFPQVGRVTVSAGFAAVVPGDTGAVAFGRADEALYVAKQRGRNQVQCHEWLVMEGSLTDAKKTGGQVELF